LRSLPKYRIPQLTRAVLPFRLPKSKMLAVRPLTFKRSPRDYGSRAWPAPVDPRALASTVTFELLERSE